MARIVVAVCVHNGQRWCQSPPSCIGHGDKAARATKPAGLGSSARAETQVARPLRVISRGSCASDGAGRAPQPPCVRGAAGQPGKARAGLQTRAGPLRSLQTLMTRILGDELGAGRAPPRQEMRKRPRRLGRGRGPREGSGRPAREPADDSDASDRRASRFARRGARCCRLGPRVVAADRGGTAARPRPQTRIGAPCYRADRSKRRK